MSDQRIRHAVLCLLTGGPATGAELYEAAASLFLIRPRKSRVADAVSMLRLEGFVESDLPNGFDDERVALPPPYFKDMVFRATYGPGAEKQPPIRT